MAVSTGQAQAATITVGSGDAAALIAAINTANGTTEADTLNVSGTYSFGSANHYWYGPTALPAITSDITIAGSATTGAVIQSTNGTRLRLFFVAGGRSGLGNGTLRLRNLEVDNGRARGGDASFGGAGAGLGGGIYNQGTLDLAGVTMAGNQATGGTAGTVNSVSGGGMGSDAVDGNSGGGGGGFGGATPGVSAGNGGAGGPGTGGNGGGGGGGGGYAAGENGGNGSSPGAGAGGGTANGLGGADVSGVRGGNGSGAGGRSLAEAAPGGGGGSFAFGGAAGPETTPGKNRGAGGGGGVGGGGGGVSPGAGGGSGGFGGGGGWANYGSGSGGFGGGGAGGDGRASGSTAGGGGFGGGNGAPVVTNVIGLGGGGAGMGGAIFNDRGTLTATNSTFTGNAATGGTSTTVFIGAAANAGTGGSAMGAAVFNLNGTATFTHATIAGNTLTAGAGSSPGLAAGSVATVGYDSATVWLAATTFRQTIATVAGTTASFVSGSGAVADGTLNRSSGVASATPGTYVGSTDPQLAALGNYAGPTRTLAPNAGSPVINAATLQGLATTDQRGFNRDASADIGAVETQATSVTTGDQTIPYSASARNLPLSATVSPARGGTAPGTLQFNAGTLGSANATISGGAASMSLAIAAGAAPGTYALSATAAAAPGFAAGSGTATIKILNPPQVCKDVSGTTAFQAAITVDTDCTGFAPATAAIVANPSHGTATIVGGALKYTPASGYAGNDEFTYTVTNEGGVSNTAKASIKVLNAAQVCKDVSGTTAFQAAITINTDCGGFAPGTASIVANPSHGTATVVGGALKYTPAAGYAGSDEFTYKVTNEGGASNTAKASIKVLAAAQVCKDVSGTTAFNTAITVATDCTGATPGTTAILGDPSHGTATVVAGALKYMPAAGYVGSDEFTYTVTNEGGVSNTAKASIKVLNPAQVCKDVSGTTAFQTAITINTDCTGATPVTAAIVGDPSHGTATVVAGALKYVPASGYAGTDTFTYKVTNEGGASNTATATIKVLNTPQVCKDVSGTTPFQTLLTIGTSCTGAAPGTTKIVAAPTHGTATTEGDTLRYTPEAGYIGTDEFTYTVTNEGGVSNTAKASVKVLAPPPVCKDVDVTVPYETRVDITVDCSRAGTTVIATGPKHGKAVLSEGTLRYTPDDGFSGTDEFTYTVINEGGTSNVSTVKLVVNPPAPTCTSYATGAGAGRGRTLTLACASIGAPTYAIIASPAHGTLSAFDKDAGTVVYTADEGYKGDDTFTYSGTNAGGTSAPATVTITVTERPALAATPSGSVTLGGVLSNTVTVTPRFEPVAGSKVDFRLFSDASCTGVPVYATSVEVAADGTAASGSYAPTAAGTYFWQATYSGDAKNLGVAGTCDPVTVNALPTVLPTVKPAETPVSVCGDAITLLDVSPVGTQARVSGIARLDLAGQQVTILRAGKTVGTATVAADGAYSAVVGGPTSGDAPPVTYTATVGANRSRAFRYDRHVRITKRTGLKIAGKLDTKATRVTLLRVNVCTRQTTSTTAKVAKNGTFSFTMRAPDAGSPYVLYRVTAQQGRHGKTYTTQVAVAR